MGEYRPWFLILGIPTGIFAFLTFTAFDLSPEGKLIYATITYFVYSVVLAVYGVLGFAMTKRLDERMTLGIYNFIYAIVGSMIPVVGGFVLVKVLGQGDDAKGFSLFMAILAVIVIVQSVLSFVFLKEKYVIPRKPEEQQFSVKEMLVQTVLQNKTATLDMLQNQITFYYCENFLPKYTVTK
jgi:GPH family glycoside/pentoside/hexuronide:cation symporter/probable glucitol transport protein GutA